MSALIAKLVFNSLTHASITGLRGSVETQQIVFEAGDLSIYLRVSKPGDERVILGQLLQHSPEACIAGAKVNFRSGSDALGTVLTNAEGEFRFNGIPTGPVTIEAEISALPSLVANFKVIGD
jgi:hypothetical protein